METPEINNSEATAGTLTEEPISPVAERMDMVRWLIGIMMVGQAFEMRASALEIYESVVTLTEDIDSLNMCLAFSTALNGDGRYAKELSLQGFDACSNSDHLNMAMAHTLRMIDDSAWRTFAEKVLRFSTNKNLRRSAQEMLKAH